MKQSSYFAKVHVRDGEFNKNHIEVNLNSMLLCIHEYMLKIVCEQMHKICFKMIVLVSIMVLLKWRLIRVSNVCLHIVLLKFNRE